MVSPPGYGGVLVLELLDKFFPSLTQGIFVNLILGTAFYLALFLIPLSIGVAILRSHLFDIDLIINRTLVYGILTVIVVGLYVLVVGYMGALFGTSGNLLISLVATGLVAVLFQPLRAFLQRGVNRLLYGQRDEPYAVITRLSQRLEATLAPDEVLSTIVETVAQALKLPYVAILLKQGETFVLVASAGELVGDPVVLPLVYQAENIGQMHITTRTPGEPLTSADRRLLEELARQAGLAAHAVQLTSDLQRSYENLEIRVEERTRELASLLDISHTVASTLELEPLLSLILNQLKSVIQYSGSTILILEGNELKVVDYTGPIPREKMLQIRYSVRLVGMDDIVLRRGEPVIIEDVRADTPLSQDYREAAGDLLETHYPYVQAFLAVPLKLRDQVIGMLCLTSTQKGYYTSHHADLALAIANQAAVAIENARLYAQAQELAAVEERQRLARELHDSVSQALYGISLGAHTARLQLDHDPKELADSLDYVLELSEAALIEMRALIFELRPESLETEGLVTALTKQAAALHARQNILVNTDLCVEPDLPLKVKQDLYRVAQEAMHNTVKHAHANKIELRLHQTDELVIMEVWDNGKGFDTSTSFPGHLGLHSMYERVRSHGGELQIESVPGQGTCILAKVPGREYEVSSFPE